MGLFLEAIEGDKLTNFFLIREREIKQASNGSEFATFLLERNLELIPAQLWDITNEQKEQLQPRSLIKGEGMVVTYRQKKLLKLSRVRLATSDDPVSISELISRKGVSREELWQELRKMMEEVTSPILRNILRRIFSERTIREKVTTLPASKAYHHAYYAGLLHQTVQLAQAAYQLLPLYPSINQDLVLSACMLCDIGKTKALRDVVAPDYTSSGELMGHLVLGIEMINEAAREAGISGDDVELVALKHLLLSQNGEVEKGYGSAVSEKTAEAILFSSVKQLNTKLHAIEMISERSEEEWVYSPMFKRKMYNQNTNRISD
ncbi:CMP-binding protein [Alkalihalophilus sp. As8PL]|uniref:CMP-binding protein n=1 Tax=Alkalihalophilus sp. As8PL TaxID=3237103 RepID=A0AB39BRA0_9BACI